MLSDRWSTVTLFWFPIAALIVSGAVPISRAWHVGVWVIALVTIGIACLFNAFRCGRVHCYLTGPFFLIIAAVTLLFGLAVEPFERLSWNLLGVVVLIGTVLLCCLPEAVFGRYRSK